MKRISLVLSTLALGTLFAGCVGMGPNTQQGAVTGGTLGAIAGAIIGNNSRGGDAFGGALLGATAGALAGGALGNSVDYQRGTLYDYDHPRAPGPGYAVAQQSVPPPPPPNAEAVTAPPAPNALRIPGYWSYNGRAYGWVAGHWEIPPPNARAYMTAHWENRGGSTVFVPGSWQ